MLIHHEDTAQIAYRNQLVVDVGDSVHPVEFHDSVMVGDHFRHFCGSGGRPTDMEGTQSQLCSGFADALGSDNPDRIAYGRGFLGG